jgi:type IV pilus assembly protein PilO
MNASQLQDLELGNIGEWPAPTKVAVILVLCSVIGVALYYFDTSDQLDRLRAEEDKELQLRTSFESKQAQTVNLDAYAQQIEEIKKSFGAMLRQLPDKTEVASLLVDVSQTGLAAGLEFELFQPEAEQAKDFYAELPIKIKVNGHYHEFGRFVSGLAALPRIVTLHDVKIDAPPAPKAHVSGASPAGIRLSLEGTVRTYRYLDEAAFK